MSGRLHPLIVLLAIVSFACGARVIEQVEQPRADGGPDDAGGAVDAGGHDAGFDPAPFCAVPAGGSSDPVDLVPRPAAVKYWGEKIAVGAATISCDGADTEALDEIEAIAAAANDELALGNGGVHVSIHPKADWTPLAAGCGLGDAQIEGAYYLVGRAEGVRARVDLFAADAGGRRHALKTLKQIMNSGGPSAREVVIHDWPVSPIRGIVEGFYGTPWTREQRLAMLPILADYKMNLYAYSPKNDVWINAFWREDFPLDDVQHIRAVATEARRNGIRACWQLHPGNGIIFSRQEDFDTLMRKFRIIAAQGIDCFILGFDDINKTLYGDDAQVYPSYVQGQVDFANRVGAALAAEYPDAMLGFVPAEYYTEHPDVQTDLRYLGVHLDRRWEVAWTGPQVVSKTITAADAATIAGIIGRPPFLGDNYPVSDNPDKTGVLNMGPLVGRSPDLPAAAAGVIFNVMPYSYASLPGVATAADYVWNPAAYDPIASLHHVARRLAGSAAARAFEALCLADRSTILEPSAAPDLDAALAAFWAAWDGGTDIGPPADALRDGFLSTFAGTPKDFSLFTGDPNLARQIAPWAEKLGFYGTAGLDAVQLLRDRATGLPLDRDRLADLKTNFAGAATINAKPTGGSMDNFLSKTLGILQE